MDIKGKVELSGNPIISMPEVFDFKILESNVPAPTLPGPTLPNPTELIDLSRVQVHNSPTDIKDWAITKFITQVRMDPNGFHFEFDTPLPENWKWRSNPDNQDDNYQYTVWPIIMYRNALNTSGIVQMWSGRNGTGGIEGLQFHFAFHKYWCYDSRWGDMSLFYPNPGDLMGFFVSAGNARGVAGITSVKERSNIVVLSLPANDNGVWNF